jgi:fatty acid desaturase
MPNNFNNFDADFDRMLSNLEKPQKAVRKGALALAWSIFLFAVALTVAGIMLSITVSPWFLIAVVVTGFYSVAFFIGLRTVASVTKTLK